MGDSLYFSMPAPFYGIESVDYYGWSFIERLCHRWFVNRRALYKTKEKYPDDTLLLHYDYFTTNREGTRGTVKILEFFLGTRIPFNPHFYQHGNHLNHLYNLNINQKAFIKDYYEKHKEELR
jgi:hypothetical protein